MKFTILKENLLKGVGIVERSIGEISHLPILQAIKITANKDNQLILTGTNLETALLCAISGKVESPGEAAISFRTLRDIVKNLAAEKLHISTDERLLSLHADNYEASLSLENVSEFPLIPSLINTSKHLTVSAAKLKDVFQKALVATQYSEVRPEINGVYVEFDRGEFICAGTDSFRLVEVSSSDKDFSSSLREKLSCIIPLRTVEIFLRVFDADDELNVYFDDNQALFESPHTTLISRLVDGEFPHYKSIIPHEAELELQAKREELENALKLTGVISGKARDVLFSLEKGGKILTVSSRENTVGENAYRIPIRMNGELEQDMRISFNWKYVLDGVSLYRGDEVVIRLINPHTPVVIQGKGEEGIIYVVAPIRE